MNLRIKGRVPLLKMRTQVVYLSIKVLCLEAKPPLLIDKVHNFLQISRGNNALHPATLTIINKVLAVNFNNENNLIAAVSGSEKRLDLSTNTVSAD